MSTSESGDEDEDSFLFTYKKNQKVYCQHKAVFYLATVLATKFDDRRDGLPVYKVHYSGWNKKWDEWVTEESLMAFSTANSSIAEDSLAQAKALEKEKAKLTSKKGEKKLQKLPDFIIEDLKEASKITGVEYSHYITPKDESDGQDGDDFLSGDADIFKKPIAKPPPKAKQPKSQTLNQAKKSSSVSKPTSARSSSKYLLLFW